MSWGSSIRGLFLCGQGQTEEWRDKKSHCLFKAMRASHAEGKPWQRELQKYLLAYRSTPHTTTGVSPAELLHERRIRTKMPEFESTEGEGERPGTTDQKAWDKDAEYKQRSADGVNKRAVESDVSEGDKVLLRRQKENKLSATYDPEPHSVVSKRGDLVVIERHVEKFIQPAPRES